MSLSITQLQDEMTAGYSRACRKVRCILRDKDMTGPLLYQTADEASPWIWSEFLLVSQRTPDAHVDLRLAYAGINAAYRALADRRWKSDRPHGYRDLMDLTQDTEHNITKLAASDAEEHDPGRFDDTDALERLIAKMPRRLRPFARLFATDLSKVEIAKRLRCSRSNVWLKQQQIAEWMLTDKVSKVHN